MTIKMDDFLKQSAERMLYDLNRDRLTILSNIEDPKWVNDYAVCMVITELKKRLEKYEKSN